MGGFWHRNSLICCDLCSEKNCSRQLSLRKLPSFYAAAPVKKKKKSQSATFLCTLSACNQSNWQRLQVFHQSQSFDFCIILNTHTVDLEYTPCFGKKHISRIFHPFIYSKNIHNGVHVGKELFSVTVQQGVKIKRKERNTKWGSSAITMIMQWTHVIENFLWKAFPFINPIYQLNLEIIQDGVQLH